MSIAEEVPVPNFEAAESLQTAVDDAEWARNSGGGVPDLSVIDSLIDAANTLLREIHMQQQRVIRPKPSGGANHA